MTGNKVQDLTRSYDGAAGAGDSRRKARFMHSEIMQANNSGAGAIKGFLAKHRTNITNSLETLRGEGVLSQDVSISFDSVKGFFKSIFNKIQNIIKKFVPGRDTKFLRAEIAKEYGKEIANCMPRGVVDDKGLKEIKGMIDKEVLPKIEGELGLKLVKEGKSPRWQSITRQRSNSMKDLNNNKGRPPSDQGFQVRARRGVSPQPSTPPEGTNADQTGGIEEQKAKDVVVSTEQDSSVGNDLSKSDEAIPDGTPQSNETPENADQTGGIEEQKSEDVVVSAEQDSSIGNDLSKSGEAIPGETPQSNVRREKTPDVAKEVSEKRTKVMNKLKDMGFDETFFPKKIDDLLDAAGVTCSIKYAETKINQILDKIRKEVEALSDGEVGFDNLKAQISKEKLQKLAQNIEKGSVGLSEGDIPLGTESYPQLEVPDDMKSDFTKYGLSIKLPNYQNKDKYELNVQLLPKPIVDKLLQIPLNEKGQNLIKDEIREMMRVATRVVVSSGYSAKENCKYFGMPLSKNYVDKKLSFEEKNILCLAFKNAKLSEGSEDIELNVDSDKIQLKVKGASRFDSYSWGDVEILPVVVKNGYPDYDNEEVVIKLKKYNDSKSIELRIQRSDLPKSINFRHPFAKRSKEIENAIAAGISVKEVKKIGNVSNEKVNFDKLPGRGLFAALRTAAKTAVLSHDTSIRTANQTGNDDDIFNKLLKSGSYGIVDPKTLNEASSSILNSAREAFETEMGTGFNLISNFSKEYKKIRDDFENKRSAILQKMDDVKSRSSEFTKLVNQKEALENFKSIFSSDKKSLLKKKEMLLSGYKLKSEQKNKSISEARYCDREFWDAVDIKQVYQDVEKEFGIENSGDSDQSKIEILNGDSFKNKLWKKIDQKVQELLKEIGNKIQETEDNLGRIDEGYKQVTSEIESKMPNELKALNDELKELDESYIANEFVKRQKEFDDEAESIVNFIKNEINDGNFDPETHKGEEVLTKKISEKYGKNLSKGALNAAIKYYNLKNDKVQGDSLLCNFAEKLQNNILVKINTKNGVVYKFVTKLDKDGNLGYAYDCQQFTADDMVEHMAKYRNFLTYVKGALLIEKTEDGQYGCDGKASNITRDSLVQNAESRVKEFEKEKLESLKVLYRTNTPKVLLEIPQEQEELRKLSDELGVSEELKHLKSVINSAGLDEYSLPHELKDNIIQISNEYYKNFAGMQMEEEDTKDKSPEEILNIKKKNEEKVLVLASEYRQALRSVAEDAESVLKLAKEKVAKNPNYRPRIDTRDIEDLTLKLSDNSIKDFVKAAKGDFLKKSLDDAARSKNLEISRISIEEGIVLGSKAFHWENVEISPVKVGTHLDVNKVKVVLTRDDADDIIELTIPRSALPRSLEDKYSFIQCGDLLNKVAFSSDDVKKLDISELLEGSDGIYNLRMKAETTGLIGDAWVLNNENGIFGAINDALGGTDDGHYPFVHKLLNKLTSDFVNVFGYPADAKEFCYAERLENLSDEELENEALKELKKMDNKALDKLISKEELNKLVNEKLIDSYGRTPQFIRQDQRNGVFEEKKKEVLKEAKLKDLKNLIEVKLSKDDQPEAIEASKRLKFLKNALTGNLPISDGDALQIIAPCLSDHVLCANVNAETGKVESYTLYVVDAREDGDEFIEPEVIHFKADEKGHLIDNGAKYAQTKLDAAVLSHMPVIVRKGDNYTADLSSLGMDHGDVLSNVKKE